MYVSAKAVIAAGFLNKWVKVSQEEVVAIVDSIPGHNALANMGGPGTGGANLRHYVRDGYICVSDGPAEDHPLDAAAAAAH